MVQNLKKIEPAQIIVSELFKKSNLKLYFPEIEDCYFK